MVFEGQSERSPGPWGNGRGWAIDVASGLGVCDGAQTAMSTDSGTVLRGRKTNMQPIYGLRFSCSSHIGRTKLPVDAEMAAGMVSMECSGQMVL